MSLLVWTLALVLTESQARTPSPSSPGRFDRATAVASNCPTFSWSGLAEADAYEIAISRVEDRFTQPRPGDATVRTTLEDAATSWTPDLESCLEADAEYAWFVRAIRGRRAGSWSEPRRFKVPAIDEQALDDAIEQLRSRHGDRALLDALLAHLDVQYAATAPAPGRSVGERLGSSTSPPATFSVRPDGTVVANAFAFSCQNPSSFWMDGDSDGFGGGDPISGCNAPAGYVADSSDCNDGDPGVYPGATELCDGVDQDCDMVVDDGCDVCGNGVCEAGETTESCPADCPA